MTVEEELTKLEDGIRRLKIEYEAYFNGGAPRAPHDTVFRVESTIKKYSDASKMNFGQRFRFNQLVQKYAVHNDLWRKKLKEKEEGRGRFGTRRRDVVEPVSDGVVRVTCSDPASEKEKVDQLLKAVVEAKRTVGESVDNIDPLAFARFVGDKTKQIRDSLGCEKVQFSVSVEEGKVKLKAAKLD
ncbi:MAG TPA: MXAN_5187 C-terminal domain-containing protein [Terriglobia bacterium]|nr:MXAN_5187 C-terminal domain-containing protein [Terriglobia bacterium]